MANFTVFKPLGVFAPFYKGLVPRLTKDLWKNLLFKAAVLMGSPGIVKSWCGSDYLRQRPPLQQYITISLLSGIFASTVETLLGGPLDHWVTFSETSQGKNSNASFLGNLKSMPTTLEKINYLYRGFFPAFLKTGVSCTV